MASVQATGSPTGIHHSVLHNQFGFGAPLHRPRLLTGAADRLFVLAKSDQQLVEIEPVTGSRRIVADFGDDNFAGLITAVSSVSYDATNQRVLLANPDTGDIYAVSVENGEHSILPRASLSEPYAQLSAIDAYSGGLLMADAYHDRITRRVSDDSSDRRLANIALKDGSRLQKIVDMTVSNDGRLVLALDAATKNVVFIDLVDGHSGVLSSPQKGSGVNFARPIALCALEWPYALVADAAMNAVIEVNLSSGNRRVLSNAAVGEGPAFGQLSGLSCDPSGTIYASDAANAAILRINRDSGLRQLISR